jgi:hypothetical protein
MVIGMTETDTKSKTVAETDTESAVAPPADELLDAAYEAIPLARDARID